jgi:hypothetical protein
MASRDETSRHSYRESTSTPARGLDMRMSITASEVEIDPEVAAAARKTICGNAIDAAEARKLLQMLGIEP